MLALIGATGTEGDAERKPVEIPEAALTMLWRKRTLSGVITMGCTEKKTIT
jgi:hypothetical protein